MIDADDLDIEEAGKHPRALDRASVTATLLYSIGLGALGVAIIAVGILGAFQHGF